MRDTGVKPWPLIDQEASNLTLVQTMLIILQAMTKTSTMMIGEVDANDILDTNQWIPSILVLVFEIITVILLMNLMVSLAVGDVTYLKHTAQDKLLKIKVNFVIEALQLSEQFGNDTFRLHTKKTATVLVVNDDGQYFTAFGDFPRENPVNILDEVSGSRCPNVQHSLSRPTASVSSSPECDSVFKQSRDAPRRPLSRTASSTVKSLLTLESQQ